MTIIFLRVHFPGVSNHEVFAAAALGHGLRRESNALVTRNSEATSNSMGVHDEEDA
jgi:hypothetical protein